MTARITADDVEFLPDGAAIVHSSRPFVVDLYDGRWFCTCRVSTAHPARECAHIRATKEAMKR